MAFDKERYWLKRKASPQDKKMERRIARFMKTPVVAVHDKPDWPAKKVGAKALRKDTKRARKLHASAS
jgi:hypothetical protein